MSPVAHGNPELCRKGDSGRESQVAGIEQSLLVSIVPRSHLLLIAQPTLIPNTQSPFRFLVVLRAHPEKFPPLQYISPSAVLNQGNFCPSGAFGNVWRHWGLSWSGQCCWHVWVEARDANCPTMHRTAVLQQSDSAQNAYSTEVEKPSCTHTFSSISIVSEGEILTFPPKSTPLPLLFAHITSNPSRTPFGFFSLCFTPQI